MRFVLATVLIACAACSGGGTPDRTEPVEVAVMSAWTLVTGAQAGPFADDATGDCPPGGAAFEDPVFEINTDACDGGTFAQPLRNPLFAGEYVHGVLWHLQLLAETESEAYVGIALGDEVLWDITVPIPGGEQVYKPYVLLDRDVPAGTPVIIHVHNHGENSYKFLDFSAGPAAVFPNFEDPGT